MQEWTSNSQEVKNEIAFEMNGSSPVITHLEINIAQSYTF